MKMKSYKCIATLTRQLSDAADEVITRADEYEDIVPYRVQISELAEQHGFDEQYAPLLAEMIRERTGSYEIEIIGDEIMFHHRSLLAQSLTPDRLAELLNNSLEWISTQVDGVDFYNTLKNDIGMDNHELEAAGYNFGEESMSEAAAGYPGITMK